jgi:hypothetical protein
MTLAALPCRIPDTWSDSEHLAAAARATGHLS